MTELTEYDEKDEAARVAANMSLNEWDQKHNRKPRAPWSRDEQRAYHTREQRAYHARLAALRDDKGLGMISEQWREAVADRSRSEARRLARILINNLTPELVRERLAEFDAKSAAMITRLFGSDLARPIMRARVFEVCDFLTYGGGGAWDDHGACRN